MRQNWWRHCIVFEIQIVWFNIIFKEVSLFPTKYQTNFLCCRANAILHNLQEGHINFDWYGGKSSKTNESIKTGSTIV